jgi:hypothetical protein
MYLVGHESDTAIDKFIEQQHSTLIRIERQHGVDPTVLVCFCAASLAQSSNWVGQNYLSTRCSA